MNFACFWKSILSITLHNWVSYLKKGTQNWLKNKLDNFWSILVWLQIQLKTAKMKKPKKNCLDKFDFYSWAESVKLSLILVTLNWLRIEKFRANIWFYGLKQLILIWKVSILSFIDYVIIHMTSVGH